LINLSVHEVRQVNAYLTIGFIARCADAGTTVMLGIAFLVAIAINTAVAMERIKNVAQPQFHLCTLEQADTGS
jgi:hypothetical protein